MKLKELYKVISRFQSVQLMDAMTGECITAVSYLEDSGSGIADNFRHKVYGISAGIAEDNTPYLRIMIDMEGDDEE